MEWRRATIARITTKTLLVLCLFLAAAAGTFVTNASSAASSPFEKNHQLYDRGEDIRSLQEFLNTHGFIIAQSGSGSPGDETSIFGLLTYRTLREFQAAHGLPSTGFFGPLTRGVINSGDVASAPASSQSTPSTSVATTATTATTTPSLPSWYTKPLPGYAPGQIILGGGSSAPVAASGTTGSDTVPPTAPSNLTAVAASLSELDLSWTTSTDNVGVTGYKVYRDGVQVGTTASTNFADTGLTASTTYTYTVKAYDAAGNVSTASNIATSTTGTWADGFAAAPAGTAQHPTLLNGYVARAPWKVAGVDYSVGYPSGTVLKDPATISMAGVSVSPGQVLITGDNITLDGYDFSLNGGYGVFIAGTAHNTTITNSNFKVGSQHQAPIVWEGQNLTVTNNVLDGNNDTSVGPAGLIEGFSPSGTLTVKYNWLKNGYSDDINIGPLTVNGNTNATTSAGSNVLQFASLPAGLTTGMSVSDSNIADFGVIPVGTTVIATSSTSVTLSANIAAPGVSSGDKIYFSAPLSEDVRYNLMENNGIGGVQNVAHPDWVQNIGGGALFSNVVIDFNTTVMSTTTAAGQGFGFEYNVPYAIYGGGSISNNTAVVTAVANMNFFGEIDVGELNGIITASNNYIDRSGMTGAKWLAVVNNGDAPLSVGVVNTSQNYNMVTGALLPDLSSAPPTSAVTVPSSNATVAGSAVTLTATASATGGMSVQFKVDGANVGSAGTASPYSISWDSTSVTNGTHTIAAVVTSTSGNYASATSTITVTTNNVIVPYVGPGNVVSGAVAWWGLRGYNAAVSDGTHKAANICRASDTTCRDINILSNGKFDLSTASSFCASTTCTVDGLYDQTGNGHDLVDAITAHRPTLTFNCLNTSLPCMTMSSAQTNPLSSVGTGITQAQPLTISTVAQWTGTANGFASIISDAQENIALYFHETANQVGLYAGSTSAGGTANTGTWYALQGVFNGSSSSINIDGTSTTLSPGAAGLASSTNTGIFGNNFGSDTLVGSMTESGLWPSALSTSTQASLDSNQQTYWGF